MNEFDITIIGGGPAGLAAASKASSLGKKVFLIEREEKLGGILKQCIHDGFGVQRFKEKLSGPEYAHKEIVKVKETNAEISLKTFVTDIEKLEKGFIITYINEKGVSKIKSDKIILATGCRERTSKQVLIQGSNPAGVMTAGQAQYYINILGKMPGKNIVILGSGDIGLIMARRMTLEGGNVLGVYEVKPTPSGLRRNIVQCLDDYSIPLHLSTTVTKVFGKDRLEAIEIAKVDEKMNPIESTKERIECDTLILSVGLIPENELAKKLDIKINPLTKGPSVDQQFETSLKGVYCCGNCMHVNDLADYVSLSAEIAAAASSTNTVVDRKRDKVEINDKFLYIVPDVVDYSKEGEKMTFFFRSRRDMKETNLIVKEGDEVIFKKHYSSLRPPEMESVVISSKKKGKLVFELSEVNK